MLNQILLASTALALIPWSNNAEAADVLPLPESGIYYPYLEGELASEIGYDNLFKSDDPAAELHDTYPTIELAIIAHLAPQLRVNLGVTMEPVLDPVTDRFFDDVGIYVDTLNVEFDIGELVFTAGKFGPGFGTAWDITPGIYGTTLAEDYELSEMLGFGVSYTFAGTLAGDVTLGANVFYADTSILSDSALTHRGRLTLADGGAANTEHLDNFSITLDGEEIQGLDGVSWNLGYRHLSPGFGDVATEHGYVAGIAKAIELGEESELFLNGEIAYLDNAFATADDALYATAGLGLVQGSWHGELAAALRRIDFAGGGSQDDYLMQVSGGYEFDNGIDFSLGYGYGEDAGVTYHVFGVRLTKAIEFSTLR